MYPVDAVVLDYLMPGMDGEDTARCMRKVRSDIPIILSSGCLTVPARVPRSRKCSRGESSQAGSFDRGLGTATDPLLNAKLPRRCQYGKPGLAGFGIIRITPAPENLSDNSPNFQRLERTRCGKVRSRF